MTYRAGQRTARSQGPWVSLAILGASGASDPSSNLGGPTQVSSRHSPATHHSRGGPPLSDCSGDTGRGGPESVRFTVKTPLVPLIVPHHLEHHSRRRAGITRPRIIQGKGTPSAAHGIQDIAPWRRWNVDRTCKWSDCRGMATAGRRGRCRNGGPHDIRSSDGQGLRPPPESSVESRSSSTRGVVPG